MPCPSEPARLRSGALLGALACLGLLGCRDMAQAEHSPAPGAIRIGFQGNLSNPGNSQFSAQGAQLAALEINRAGGVNGQPIEVVIAYDLAGSVSGLPGIQSLVAGGVVGIIGGPTSAIALQSFQQVTGPAGIPLVSYAATSASLTTTPGSGDLLWRTAPSDAFQGVVLARKIRETGIRTVCVIYRNDAYGQGLSGLFQSTFESLGGTILNKVSYSATKTSNFGAEVTQLFAKGVPEGVLLVSLSPDGGPITREIQLAAPSPAPRYFGGDGMFNQDVLRNGAAAVVEGMCGTTFQPPLSSPDYQRFLQAFRSTLGTDPGPFSAAAYDALYLLAYAMAAGGAATPAAIRQNLRAVSRPEGPSAVAVGVNAFAAGVQVLRNGGDLDYNGASGRIDFDAKGDITSGTYTWWKVVNGAFQTVDTVTVP